MNNQEEMKKDELNAAPETAEAAGETEEKTASPQEKTAEPAVEEAPEQPEEKKEDKKDEKKKGFFSKKNEIEERIPESLRGYGEYPAASSAGS